MAAKNIGEPRSQSFVIERPQPPARKPHRDKLSQNNFRLPPRPPLPKPPANWEELSTERVDGAESSAELQAQKDKQAAERKSTELKKPVVSEDWSLVRTKDKQCGWVLSRNLIMSIPDEVAQYAEGKRITSYFDLGAVSDEAKGEKHNWLWTSSAEPEPYDFDAWRVFLWNRRHHRYETSYRLRDVEGYFPVHVDPPDSNAFGRTFEIITKDDDGKFRRRTYLFDGVRVHLTATEYYRPTTLDGDNKPATLDTSKLQQKTPRPGWFSREWTQLKRRLSGGA
jgi:hypothetical protein